MTDLPYTDDDLRAEAANQHATLTTDPDHMGVGEQMASSVVESTDDGTCARQTWSELLVPPTPNDTYEAFGDAQQKIAHLIEHAACISEWAVNLGADGLEPEDHQISFKAGDKPIIRVHFAFAPELSDEARAAFVEGLGAAAAREMQLALSSN